MPNFSFFIVFESNSFYNSEDLKVLRQQKIPLTIPISFSYISIIF